MLQSRSTLIFSFILHCIKLSWVSFWLVPANICLDEDILKRSWRRLLSSSSEDVLITTNIFALVIRLQKTSSRRLGQDQYIRLGHTSSRCLQDVFKTSSRRLAKTSSRHLQDVFKTYHQAKLFLVTRLREVFNLLLRRNPKMAIYKGICLGHTTSEKFMVSAQNLQER